MDIILCTNHFTLAHKHNSMEMSAKRWILHEESHSSNSKTTSRKVKAPSTIRRKVGSSDDPGLRMLEKKAEISTASVVGVDIGEGGKFARWGCTRTQHMYCASTTPRPAGTRIISTATSLVPQMVCLSPSLNMLTSLPTPRSQPSLILLSPAASNFRSLKPPMPSSALRMP